LGLGDWSSNIKGSSLYQHQSPVSFFLPPSIAAVTDPVYAAVDLGTNNCRMLVARPDRAGFRVVDCFSRITRLGEGLAASGRLSDDAMTRTVEALKHCADRMTRNRVSRARMVATEACRRAANHRHFTDRVAASTGLILDIITPTEEASLALAGCASLLAPNLPWALVFDIGGGSTEMMWVSHRPGHRTIEGVVSLPLGVVTLAESHGCELGTASGYQRVVADVTARLAPFEAHHRIGARLEAGNVQMLGTSGTVTTLAALHLDLDRYDRSVVDGITLSFADIATVTDRLATMSTGDRARHPCVGPERADLVLAGCAILEAMCRLWPLGSLRVADRGVREGLLLTMMESDAAGISGMESDAAGISGMESDAVGISGMETDAVGISGRRK
jgi:exopolyphosphatase / guanosine-5'-triphosphate,3'-diphosphate pyrophosphatase